jgi:hypothetical protein
VIECKKKGKQLAVAESLADNKCLHLNLAEMGIFLSFAATINANYDTTYGRYFKRVGLDWSAQTRRKQFYKVDQRRALKLYGMASRTARGFLLEY